MLPSDPKWFVIDASDGDPRRWPANTSPNPDSEGNVNYMQPIPIDSPLTTKWRTTIGQRLAEMLDYPDHGLSDSIKTVERYLTTHQTASAGFLKTGQ